MTQSRSRAGGTVSPGEPAAGFGSEPSAPAAGSSSIAPRKEQYETKKGCLTLGIAVLVTMAALVVLILVRGQP